MDSRSHVVLAKSREILVKHLDIQSATDHLLAKQVITREDRDRILAERLDYGKRGVLLDLLPEKGQEALKVFLDYLADAQYGLHHLLINNLDTPTQDQPEAVDTARLPCYRMDRKPRGICVIINNVNFHKIENDPTSKTMCTRKGSDVDKDGLIDIFGKLGFIPHVHDDLTAQAMHDFLKDTARVDHTMYDCLVCCVLTHGVSGWLYGVDGRAIKIRSMTEVFKGASCRTLRGKPKLFFIQACRGKETQQGFVPLDVERDQPEQEGEASGQYQLKSKTIPNEADFLLGYATVPGFQSYRSTTEGSWYIGALVRALDTYALTHDLLSILVIVNKDVASSTARNREQSVKQVPAPLVTLRMKLFLAGPTTQELQQALRHNIKEYLRNDPSRLLGDVESALYINQPVRAQMIGSGDLPYRELPKNVSELIESCSPPSKRIFVYGEAGVGKTSLCRQIAQTWTEGQSKFSQNVDYVFPIQMRSIRSHSVVDVICRDTKLLPTTCQHRIEQELEQKSVLFIFDSFEELSYTTPEIHELIRRELYPESSVLITARPGHKLEEAATRSVPYMKTDLLNLTEEQVKQYVAANCSDLPHDTMIRMERRFGMSFLRKPINIWLLCHSVFQIASGTITPDTQTVLLNMIVQELMFAYTKKKKLPEFTLTTKSPMKNAPSEVKVLLEKTGRLCYFGLRDKIRALILDDGVLSRADVMATGLFAEGGNDNSVTLPHPLFQEYLAALYLSVDKRARQDLFTELREDLKRTPRPTCLVGLLLPRGLDNMMRFLVGLLPCVGKEMAGLFVILQTDSEASSLVQQADISYELELLRESDGKAGKSAIAAELLKAPVKMTLGYLGLPRLRIVSHTESMPLEDSNFSFSSPMQNSHLILTHIDEEQQQAFLRKFYGCQICKNELTQIPGSQHFWIDSFVWGMIYLYNCSVRMKKACIRDCLVPVSSLTNRLAGVEDLTLKDCTLCYLTDSQILASLNLAPLSKTVGNMPPAECHKLSLSSVSVTNVRGLNLLSPPLCILPTTDILRVTKCGDVSLGSLRQCFTGVSELYLLLNERVYTDSGDQWPSVRVLDLNICTSADLTSLRKMFVQLRELSVYRTTLRLSAANPLASTLQGRSRQELDFGRLVGFPAPTEVRRPGCWEIFHQKGGVSGQLKKTPGYALALGQKKDTDTKKREEDWESKWDTVECVDFDRSELCTEERTFSRGEIKEFLRHFCPQADIGGETLMDRDVKDSFKLGPTNCLTRTLFGARRSMRYLNKISAEESVEDTGRFSSLSGRHVVAVSDETVSEMARNKAQNINASNTPDEDTEL